MPRAPSVPTELLKGVILNTIGVVDESGNVCPPSNPIWAAINDRVDNKLSPKYIYVFVNENRRNVYTELLEHYGIPAPSTFNISSGCSSSSSSLAEKTSLCSENVVVGDKVLPQTTFVVKISPEDWDKMKPVDAACLRSGRGTLRYGKKLQEPWGDIVVKYLWDQHKLPCPYTMKRARVFSDNRNRDQYIKFTAVCKECGSSATGRILEEPTAGSYVTLEWRGNDSRGIPHDKKRHLKGKERREVATVHLKNASATVYRRQRARDLMLQGDVIPPNLHSTAVLRKSKQEQRDESLGINQNLEPILDLCRMKHSGACAGSIHDIGLDKVFVIYYLPNQLFVYKNFRRGNYTILSLDATGSVVQKIKRFGQLSGHIFLYEFVLHTGTDQLPVLQMLSEKQDANTILYMINEWTRHGAPCPNEVVVDGSAALKSALARSFGKSASLQTYVDKLFRVAMGDDDIPPCFIRIDVAHFIHTAKRWKLWDVQERKRLKDFYLRCLGLLIKAESIVEFEELLTHILRLAMSPTESIEELSSGRNSTSDEDSDQPCNTVQESRKILAERIRGNSELIIASPSETELMWLEERSTEDETQACQARNTEKINKDITPTIKQWVARIADRVKTAVSNDEDEDLNGYYCPAVAKELIRVSSEFVLWSAVLVRRFKSPKVTASSAPVESDFADLKTRVLQGSFKMMQLNRFIPYHLKSIESQCYLTSAPKKRKRSEEAIEDLRAMTATEKTKNMETTNSDKEDEPDEELVELSRYVDLMESLFSQLENSGIEEVDENQVNIETSGVNPPLFRPWLSSASGLGAEDTTSENNPTEKSLNASSGLNAEGTMVESASENNYKEKNAKYTTVEMEEITELNFFENWKGKANAKRPRSKYLNPLPQFEAAVSQNRLKQPSLRMLKNGNVIREFMTMETGTKARVINTCPFDAVCQALAEVYITDKNCREYFEQSNSGLLATARFLAIDGAVSKTYRKRMETLAAVLTPKEVRNFSKQKNQKKKPQPDVLGLEYNCWSSVRETIERNIGDGFSIVIDWNCTNKECALKKNVSMITVEPLPEMVICEGMEFMRRAVLRALKLRDEEFEEYHSTETEQNIARVTVNKKCSNKCGHDVTVTYRFGPVIFVDVEYLCVEGFGSLFQAYAAKKRPYGLGELPEQLQLLGVNYQLIAVVAHGHGHYVSYTRQTATRWDVFDDMAKDITNCDDGHMVTPAMLVYFRT